MTIDKLKAAINKGKQMALDVIAENKQKALEEMEKENAARIERLKSARKTVGDGKAVYDVITDAVARGETSLEFTNYAWYNNFRYSFDSETAEVINELEGIKCWYAITLGSYSCDREDYEDLPVIRLTWNLD